MLEFNLSQELETCVEVFQITPDKLSNLSLEQIKRQTIYYGNQSISMGELFSVSGDSADLHHVWKGDLTRVGGIGYRMTDGWIQIEGNVGNHVGSRIRGGTIHVSGDAGNHVGAEMTGGMIHVKGNAGASVGAAYDGGSFGQNGGVILIEGSAGNAVGSRMRRGVIAIGGDVGNGCGFLMKAGTIVVFGLTQKNVGLEMLRGTIVLMKPSVSTPTGFVNAGGHSMSMTMTRLVDRYLTQIGFPIPFDHHDFQIWHGDCLHGGRGELLIAR